MKNKISNSYRGILLFALGFVALFTSCATSEYSDFQTTESGLRYKFHIQTGDTVHPNYGEVVRLKLSKFLKDSLLESSDLVNPDGLEQMLYQGAFSGAIEEGITMMSIGDSATFLIPTDSINKYYPGKDSLEIFPADQFLIFNVKLMNIQTQEQVRWVREQNRLAFVEERRAKEPTELSQYISDNNIEVQPSKTGLYLIVKEKGNGIKPVDGDSVTVHYTGSFLNGTIFDSSVERKVPFGFIVNAEGPRGVIHGWNEAIKAMSVGEVATLILPSALAYDSTGYMNPQTGKYFIPPYSPMKFDIQLLEITPQK